MNPPINTDGAQNNNGSIPSIDLLGLKIHCVDMDDTLKLLKVFIESSQPHMVVTADSSGIVLAQSDNELMDIVNNADLVTPDSSGILWGARKLGTPLKNRVSGVDIAAHLCRMSSEDGFSVIFLGAAPGVAELAAENLSREYPRMKVAGVHHGYFTEADDPEIVEKIRQSGASVLFVAMGIPKQEKWIRRYLDEMGVSIAIGVGGSFDVFSGRVKRAPEWMQHHGLEWVYRLAKNPRKISKVSTLPKYWAMVMRESRSK